MSAKNRTIEYDLFDFRLSIAIASAHSPSLPAPPCNPASRYARRCTYPSMHLDSRATRQRCRRYQSIPAMRPVHPAVHVWPFCIPFRCLCKTAMLPSCCPCDHLAANLRCQPQTKPNGAWGKQGCSAGDECADRGGFDVKHLRIACHVTAPGRHDSR